MVRYVNNVARNHGRILNHLGLMQQKMEVGEQLGLVTSQFNIGKTNQEHKELFENFIERMLPQICDSETLSNHILPVGLLELHPTDICNLDCVKCYYSRSTNTLPLLALVKILPLLNPKGIVLVGGGEPTLYYDKETKSNFSSLVLAIKRQLPYVKLGLITNGTVIPRGEWIKHIDWLRVSVDAASAETYEKVKGFNLFEKVINNLLSYLTSDVPHVGAGFVCNQLNIQEAPTFIEFLRKKIDSLPIQTQRKLNIQFRPFRKKINPHSAISDVESQNLVCSDEQFQVAASTLENMRRNVPLAQFMDLTSNWEKITDVTINKRYFDHCYRALVFSLLRPNGDLYPCFAHIDDPEYIMANILRTDVEKELLLSGLKSFYFFNCYGRYCSAALCPLFHENMLCTKQARGQKIHVAKHALGDPFF